MNVALSMDPDRNASAIYLKKYNQEIPVRISAAPSERGVMQLNTVDINKDIIRAESNNRLERF